MQQTLMLYAMKKLVFVRPAPVSSYDLEIDNVDVFRSHGFQVEYLVTQSALSTAWWLSDRKSVSRPGINIIEPKSVDEMRDYFFSLTNSDCVINGVGFQVNQPHKYSDLWVSLWASRAKLGVISNYPYNRAFLSKTKQLALALSDSVVDSNVSLLLKFGRVRGLEVLDVFRRLWQVEDQSLVIATTAFRPLDYVWTLPGRGHYSPWLASRETEVDFVRAFDADLLSRTPLTTDFNNTPYFLFIDSMAGLLHPDYRLDGNFHPDSQLSHDYYDSLRSLLSHTEKQTRLTCVVAPHPKNEAAVIGPYFKGFQVGRETTFSLIQKAEFVVAEPSNSIGLCSLLGKPTAIVSADHLPTINRRIARFFAGGIGASIYESHRGDRNLNTIRPSISMKLSRKFAGRFLEPPGTTTTASVADQILASLA